MKSLTHLELLAPLWANAVSVALYALGLLLIVRMMREKRRPGNLLGWAIFILFLPLAGIPLYILFGGRKSRTLVRKKREVLAVAQLAAERAANSQPVPATNPGNSPKAAPAPLPHESSRDVYHGNRVTLLHNGVETFRVLLQEINTARQSIHIMTYILGRDATARTLLEALTRRASEGIQVRLLVDAFGSYRSTGSQCDALRRAGGQVARFMPILPAVHTQHAANLRNHRKISIFDNSRAITGGQNIDARFLSETDNSMLFKDISTHIQGPAVAALNHIFVADWTFAAQQDPFRFTETLAHRPLADGQSTLEIIASGPDCDGDPLWERILHEVQEARESITIVTPYFLPDDVLHSSLLVKARAGRQVRIIVPESSNHPIVDTAREYHLQILHKAGAQIAFYQPGVIHAKLMLIDGKLALSGSANMDPRSFFVNFEVGILHTNPEDIRNFADWIDNTLPACLEYSDTRRARKNRPRLLVEEFAHLLKPIL